jgi:hypothetical protein
MKINPSALLLWIFCAGVGYLVGGVHAAIVWGVVALGISLLVSLIYALTGWK